MRNLNNTRWSAVLVAAGLLATQSANALAIKSVGSVMKGTATQVTVVFDQTVESASATALANYTLAGQTIASATLMTGLPSSTAVGNVDWPAPGGRADDNQCVILTVNGTLTGNQTLTVNNVRNTSGSETIASTVRTFLPSGYKWTTVGPADADPTRVIAVGTNGFDIYSNGAANWDARDEIGYVYKEIPANQPFDVKVRVEFQDTASRWGRAGLMLRQSLNEGSATTAGTDGANPASRTVFARTNPARKFDENSGAIGVGENQFEFIYRTDTGGNYTGPGDGTDPAYPNAWVRLVGDGVGLLKGYWSNDADPSTDTFSPTDGFDLSAPYAGMLGDGATTLYLGPAYCPETVNINALVDTLFPGQNIRSRRFLGQFRFNIVASPVISAFNSFAAGFTSTIIDGADTTVQDGSVSATVGGTAVTVTQRREGNRTIIAYVTSNLFAVGSTTPIVLSYRDNTGATISRTYSHTQAAYATLPARERVQAPTGAGIYGMTIRGAAGVAHNNVIANVEGIFAGTFGADTAAFEDGIIPVMNWDQSGDVNTGVFNSGGTGTRLVTKDSIPAVSGEVNNVATLVTTYLDLPAGYYRMGVNSDDGFRVSVGQGAGGQTLGSFDGGRGATDSMFDFAVSEAGVYPFRVLWFEGGGGASCDWFVEDIATGTRRLVNQQRTDASGARLDAEMAANTLATGAIRAYNRTPTVRAQVTGVSPAGYDVDIRPTVSVSVTLNGSTVTANNATALVINGTAVPVTRSDAGGIATFTGTVTTALPFNKTVTGTFTYSGGGFSDNSTVPISFTTRSVRSSELAKPGVFVIEAEDFDFNNGQIQAAANTMPYEGGAYADHGGVVNVDFQRGDGPFNTGNGSRDGFNYRLGAIMGGSIVNDPAATGIYVPMGGNTGGNASNGDLRTDRPGQAADTTSTVTTSFSVGWATGWYNYTRNIPAGNYNVYAALSYDGRADNQLAGRMERVTAGRGTANQTVELLGTFSRFGSGGWGPFALVPMVDAGGNLATVPLGGSTPTTVRYTATSGDFDWYAFVPASAPPVNPAITGIRRDGNNVIIDFVGGTLQSSSTLGSGYSNVSGVTGNSATITLPAGAGQQFYRVFRAQ